MTNPDDCEFYYPWEQADEDLAGDLECYHFLGGPFGDTCTCGDSPHADQPCPWQGLPVGADPGVRPGPRPEHHP